MSPIGNGPDYYIGVNENEERIMALADKMDEWWNSLDDSHKFELLEPYYPDELHLMGMDEAWERLSWEDQLEAYKDNNGYNEVEV